jgi:hypothetical protein
MGALVGLVQQIAAFVPPWVTALLVVALAAWGIPGFLWSVKTKQIRERVRRMIRATPEGRARALDEAMAIAGDDVVLVTLLAREARRLEQVAAADRALRHLEGLPGGSAEAVKLRATAARPPTPTGHALGEAFAVRALLDEGLPRAASARWEAARTAFPGDPHLEALGPVIAAASLDATHDAD